MEVPARAGRARRWHGQRGVVGEGPGSECQGRAAGPAAVRLATCPVHQRSGEGPRGAGGRTGDPALREGPPLSGGRTRPVRTCEAAFRSAEEPRRRGPAAPRLPAREAHGREQNRAFVDEACAHRFNHWPFGRGRAVARERLSAPHLTFPGITCLHFICFKRIKSIFYAGNMAIPKSYII